MAPPIYLLLPVPEYRVHFYVLLCGIVHLASCDFAMDSTKQQHYIRLASLGNNATEILGSDQTS
jgi:hypothetical protein